MKIVSLIKILFLLLSVFGFVFSQKNGEKPNFTGTWILKYVDIEFGLPRGMSGRVVGNMKLPNCDTELVIEHDEPTIKLKSTEKCVPKKDSPAAEITEINLEYFTDARGETNTFQSKKISTSTHWNKLVLTINQQSTDNKQKQISEIRYKLSKDKAKLEETVTRFEKEGLKNVTVNRYELKKPVILKKT